MANSGDALSFWLLHWSLRKRKKNRTFYQAGNAESMWIIDLFLRTCWILFSAASLCQRLSEPLPRIGTDGFLKPSTKHRKKKFPFHPQFSGEETHKNGLLQKKQPIKLLELWHSFLRFCAARRKPHTDLLNGGGTARFLNPSRRQGLAPLAGRSAEASCQCG